MASAVQVQLEPGRVYRTADLSRWGRNPTRLAARLVARSELRRLGHGLFYAPRPSRFGEVPPTDEALLDCLLGGTPYVVTGPPRWNALGLGATAVFARTLVYNMKWSGTRAVGTRTYEFQRTSFPVDPPSEWFVIDLLRHASDAGVDRDDVERHLAVALAAGRFDAQRLREMAATFGGHAEREVVRRAVATTESAA